MQSVPKTRDLAATRKQILAVAGVSGLHDLHVWTVAGSDTILTAHIVLDRAGTHEGVRAAILAVLSGRFDQVTLQMEDVACGSDAAALWAVNPKELRWTQAVTQGGGQG